MKDLGLEYPSKDFPLEVKDLSEDGTFEGYGSVFGVVDAYGEKVMPGAFVESLRRHKREGSAVVMLWSHDTHSPIGVWEDLAEDAKGLWGKGRLLKGEVQKATETYALMKAKAITGLSIGYREIEAEPDKDNPNIRLLKKLDLLEISPVAFPANRRARVTTVKSEEFAQRFRAGNPPSIREFEEFLRESGFPKSVALAIASRGYGTAIRSESDGERAKKLALLRLQIATI